MSVLCQQSTSQQNERGRHLSGLLWFLGLYVQDVERVLELIHTYPPLVVAIQNELAGQSWR
jgi:hypothetical protein